NLGQTTVSNRATFGVLPDASARGQLSGWPSRAGSQIAIQRFGSPPSTPARSELTSLVIPVRDLVNTSRLHIVAVPAPHRRRVPIGVDCRQLRTERIAVWHKSPFA